MAGGMTRPIAAAAIEWNRAHIALWSARADALRAEGTRSATNRAQALDSVVRGLSAAIALASPAAAPIPGDSAEADRVEARLAACQPSLYPGTNIMLGVGPIMDAVRHDLRERLALLRGEPAAPARAVQIVEIVPTAEARPFVAGPQLDLFGMVA